MASPPDRPESPEVDFSVIRTSIDMGHKMIDQILHGIHYGSDEVRNLLRDECDFILECKVCRNLFRSFPNFVAHKRVYCIEYHEEKEMHNKFESHADNEEAVIVQPEAPEDIDKQSKEMPGVSTVVENVINNNFKGKSKEYQLYTKVAEDVERRKVAKTTNTIVLTPMPGCANAFEVHKTKGESSKNNSPKKSSPVKITDKAATKDTVSPVKNKNSVKSVCADLVKKKIFQGSDLGNNILSERPGRLATRSRKSSPRKSMEYMETSGSKEDDEECMEVDTEDVEDGRNDGRGVTKDIIELCDFKNMKCKVCKMTFSRRCDLTYHVKVKHTRYVVQNTCPCCDHTFNNFTMLARHLKNAHHKNEAFINSMKAKLNKSKSPDKTDCASTTSYLSHSIAKDGKANVLKVTDNLLSCSTGWKKCDKCGKVFWKAKSYKRHYSTCKGSVTNQSSSADKAKTRQSPMNNEAFMKLEEKLRAGVIQTIYPEDVIKNISTETSKEKRETKVETIHPAKSKMDKKTVSAKGKQTDDSLNVDSMEVKSSLNSTVSSLEKSKTPVKQAVNVVHILPDANQTKTSKPSLLEKLKTPVKQPINTVNVLPDANQTKTYNLRLGNISKNQVTENLRDLSSVKLTQDRSMPPESEMSKITKDVSIDSPGFKKLEERLVKEAGLDEPVIAAENMGNTRLKKLEERLVKEAGPVISAENMGNTGIKKLEERLVKEAGPVIVAENMGNTGIKKLEERLVKEAGLDDPVSAAENMGNTRLKKLEERLVKEAGLDDPVIAAENMGNTGIKKLEERLVKEAGPVIVAENMENTGIKKLEKRLVKEAGLDEPLIAAENMGNTRLKKLEERLVREAGLDEHVITAENVGNMPDTNIEEHAEMRTRKASSEPENIDVPATGLKDSKHHRESPKIKLLMEKLTREVLESKAVTSDEKQSDGEADKGKIEGVVEEGRPKRTTRLSSIERKNDKGSEKVIENDGMNITASCGKRSSSRDSSTGKEAMPAKTPEKLNLDMNLSPVSSPGRGTNLPSSPTPSMQSTDSYNLKFKMTVQEMAELVESASLSKFAKERKKRARTILNKKQIKEAQKIQPSLSKPMKQHVKKRHIIIRNVYGTRNQGGLQGSKAGTSPNVQTRNTNRNSSSSEFTPTVLKEKQDQTKKLTREQKRLMNSEGFVEENFYSVSHLMRERHSDSDTEGRRNVPERKRLSASSKDHLVKNKHPDSGHSSDSSKSPKTCRRKGMETVTKNSSITSQFVIDLTSNDESSAAMEEVNDSEVEDTEKNSKKTATSIRSDEPMYSLRGLDEDPAFTEKSSDVVVKKNEEDTTKCRISTRLSGKSNLDVAGKDSDVVTKVKTADNDENQLDTRHRTRLSTGSIFFDSELLTMSPSKAEKIVNDRNRKLKVTNRDGEKPLLSFSARVADIENKSKSRPHGATSEPQRYSLATGVQQCLKCKRKFWKNSTYRSHMNNSPCSTKRAAKKRALSITPDGKNGNGRSEDIASDTKSKRPKGDTTGNEVDGAKDNDKNVLDGQKENNSNIERDKIVVDVVAGPSGTNLSEVDYDSDEDGSDFSGFSEDDLKTSELELSQVDLVKDDEELEVPTYDTDGPDRETNFYLDGKQYLEDKISEDESQSSVSSKRPVRKSALKRFSHVEEIWVYKDVGKPVVEKSKGVRNREFVVDASNPGKFHYYNSTMVDKLIDEVNLKCKQCETPCSNISNLRRHVIRHLGWVRYKCKKCSFTCYDLSYCRQHTYRIHNTKLTTKNFDSFMTDLKREANWRRSAKRYKTLQQTKIQSQHDSGSYSKKSSLPGQSMGEKSIKRTSNATSSPSSTEPVRKKQPFVSNIDLLSSIAVSTSNISSHTTQLEPEGETSTSMVTNDQSDSVATNSPIIVKASTGSKT